MRLLTNEELDVLSQYKHSVSKSSLEKWLAEGPTGYAEQLFPSFLSANCLTYIGQLPICLLLFYVLSVYGANISTDSKIDPKVFVASAILLQWFV